MKKIEKTVSRRAAAGFTLVELLLVVAILGVLATVAIMNMGGLSTEARIKATRTSISTIQTAIQTYEIRNGKYPDTLEQLTQSDSDTIAAPLKMSDLNDAFGTKFEYKRKGNRFEIRSAGPDGQMNTADDILNEAAE